MSRSRILLRSGVESFWIEMGKLKSCCFLLNHVSTYHVIMWRRRSMLIGCDVWAVILLSIYYNGPGCNKVTIFVTITFLLRLLDQIRGMLLCNWLISDHVIRIKSGWLGGRDKFHNCDKWRRCSKRCWQFTPLCCDSVPVICTSLPVICYISQYQFTLY